MTASNHEARASTHIMFASAATIICSVIIVALLFTSTLRMQEPDVLISSTAQDESYPAIINKSKMRRRRLSSSDLQCPNLEQLNRPKPALHPTIPNLLQTSTYAASFPGSGYKLITKHLVESITGMLVGEASISPSMERMKVQKMDKTGFARGQGEVIVLRTHFPHTTGKLAAYDDFVPRAFVILRNPLHAIRSYFDQLYAKSHRLPIAGSDSEERQRAAWITWRDSEFSSQLLLYREFVSFWMEKYLGKDEQRMYFSYESLVDDEEGAMEAVRLATFLEGGVKANAMVMPGSNGVMVAEAVKTFANVNEVPCLWKDIVHATLSEKTPTTGVILGEPNNVSFYGGERPFMQEHLAATSEMLMESMKRWGHHKRVLMILSGYYQEVQRPLQM